MSTQAILDEVWRDHWGRLLGQLMRRFARPDLVEDALATAFADAVQQWPAAGPPDNPAGWLYTVAGRRVMDAQRREQTARDKAHLLIDTQQDHDLQAPTTGVDDRLALLFMTTHPALAEEVRPALALRFVLGVPTADIARLFLLPTSTMAARLTRAKTRLARSGIPFAVPAPQQWPQRIEGVARAIYLAFTAGYAPGGEEVVQARAAGEAVRLALLAEQLLPAHPVPQALSALVLLQHARRDARVGPGGRLVPLAYQDRSQWRGDEIDAGLARLSALSPTEGYAEELRLQALLAAFHDTAAQAGDTNWAAIARTYAKLERLTGSPIVRLNRAVAVAEVAGPMAGLALLRAAAERLPGHHRVSLVRAELLRRDGQREAARAAYTEALRDCPPGAERQHITERLAEL